MQDVTVHDNLFYRLQGRAIAMNSSSSWTNILVEDNRVQIGEFAAHAVDHNGPLGPVTYRNNTYWSGAPSDAWFSVDSQDYSLGGWANQSGETNASSENPRFCRS